MRVKGSPSFHRRGGGGAPTPAHPGPRPQNLPTGLLTVLFILWTVHCVLCVCPPPCPTRPPELLSPQSECLCLQRPFLISWLVLLRPHLQNALFYFPRFSTSPPCFCCDHTVPCGWAGPTACCFTQPSGPLARPCSITNSSSIPAHPHNGQDNFPA